MATESENEMRLGTRGSGVLVAALLVACTPRDAIEVQDPSQRHPIVGGVVESGWNGVGALVAQVPFWGYEGSFCTGSLIDPRWVLTAAHCVEDEAGGLLDPSTVRFYLGPDARPAADGGPPASGTLVPVQSFHRHPQWDSENLRNDIAMVRLAQAVQGAPIYAYNQQSLSAALVGHPVLYVGFGATEGINVTGGGLKRSTQILVSSIGSSVYVGNFSGTGVCFGDSGGPGLLQENGTWRVIGINSSVASSGGDPCKGSYNHTRVDRHAPWIAGVLGQVPPSCQSDPGLCFCTQACQGDGSCDNSACQTHDCEQVYDCLVACDDSATCQLDCYDTGTSDAQAALDAMLRCFDTECASASTTQAYQTCIGTQCASAIDLCMPPANCDLRGGECASTLACGPTATGATDCFASLSHAEGASCRLGPREPVECADGLFCVGPAGGATGQCKPLCLGQSDCAADALCDTQRIPELQGAGVCLCTDQDQDGACASADCNDLDARRYPGAAELCNDGIDNNCNGQIDEGCVTCIDADGDGSCSTEDCDDSRSDVRPGLTEVCGDSRDNNCNNQIDEGCVVCIDADGDGSCSTEDCDDSRSDVKPGLAEVCGDGRDNNCNRQIDEGCVVCIDADGDGSCSTEDCDDSRSDVRPGLTEVCGDGRDNNCNSQVDEGCVVCIDVDQDGFCSDVDCDDSRAAVHPGAVERCDDELDNNCDGQVGEGCVFCTDDDQDGFCSNRDCDDQDASANPGAAEQCGDHVDNDCDGDVDEDCVSCTDEDEDGFCANRDCDDHDAAVNPGQAERCGDQADNDCDGDVDEGCEGCVDGDADGFCAALDCDDGRADTYPGAAELCGDALDNSCDGQVDEGCAACLDVDKDGFCTQLDCDDRDPARSPAATEVCGDDVDNNCDGETDESCALPSPTDRMPHVDEPGHEATLLCAQAGRGSPQPAVLWALGLVTLFGLRRRPH
ncbi:MAG: MopE-related protein [Pseudomonadota bacterium]